MDMEIHILSEVSQRQIPYDISHMWNLKTLMQMKLFTKQKQTYRTKTNLWLPVGNGGRGINGDGRMDICTLLYLK